MPTCFYCGAPTPGRRRVCNSFDCISKMKESWLTSRIVVPEGFLTATRFAKKAGISVQAVAKNCRRGKYAGSFQDEKSGRWYIPEDCLPLNSTGKEEEKIAINTELIFRTTYDDPDHEFTFAPQDFLINGVSIVNVDRVKSRINLSGLLELIFYQKGNLIAKDTVLDGAFEFLEVFRDGVHHHYRIIKTDFSGRP